MPQVEINASALLKESQKDEKPRAEFGPISFKDNTIVQYDGAKRLVLAKNKQVVINVDHLSAPIKILGIELSVGTKIRLRLRKTSTESTDLEVNRFFFAELSNIEQIALLNEQKDDAVVLVFLAARP